ncbi:MAG: exodeoxyribonuclease VII large subunit, partial [Alphaproteobacteria bacterium]
AAASKIPLISAVGHETDTTLIDFAADVRAPTPTAAAEMAVPVRAELLEDILDQARRLVGTMERYLETHRTHLKALARGLIDPKSLLEMAAQRLDDWTDRMRNAMTQILAAQETRLAAIDRLIESLSYTRVLERGFALVRGPGGEPIMSARKAKPGMAVGIRFQDGEVGAVIDGEKPKPAKATAKKPRRKAGQGELF